MVFLRFFSCVSLSNTLIGILFALFFVETFILPASANSSDGRRLLSPAQRTVVEAAADMLERLEVSYVYGGANLGTDADCDACNECLETRRPTSKKRLDHCPTCLRCSIDCSHFTQLIFSRAKLPHPYLTSKDMARLAPDVLLRRYSFLVVDPYVDGSQAIWEEGDLLVYDGHVVLVEKVHGVRKASSVASLVDIIHATGGKDVKGPGQGIQRERAVDPRNYRGPLLRILRHKKIASELALFGASSPARRATIDPALNLKKLKPLSD